MSTKISDIKNAQKVPQNLNGPVAVFLQTNCHECTEFQEKQFITAVGSLAVKLKELHLDLQLRNLSLLLFGSSNEVFTEKNNLGQCVLLCYIFLNHKVSCR